MIIKSLSLRLFILLIISNGLLAYGLIQATTFVMSMKNSTALMLNNGRIEPPKFEKYLKELGNPPTLEAAKKLQKEENVSVIVYDKNENELFKSNGELPTKQTLEKNVFNQNNALDVPVFPHPSKSGKKKGMGMRGHHPPSHHRGGPMHMPPPHPPQGTRHPRDAMAMPHRFGQMGLYEGNLFQFIELKDHLVVLLFQDHLARFLSRSSKAKLAIFGLIILVSLFFSIYLVKQLLSPLKNLVLAAKRVGEGNWDTEVPSFSTNEFNTISKEFNRMVKKVHGMIDARDYLLRALNHELRGPLARMKINAEMVQDERLQKTISEDIDELEELMENILQLEKLQTGANVDKQSFNLFDLASEQVQRFGEQAYISLNSEKEEVMLYADPIKVKILIRNLIENAIKYNDKENKRIIVNLVQDEKSTLLQVQDNGVGISQDHIDKIYDPFFRVESSRNKKLGGLGLGLNISKEITRLHDAELDVASKLGEGTTFSITFPNKTN